jgi:hypothetical protein
MTVLEPDVARLRRKAALAVDLSARIVVLSEEIIRTVKEEHELAEACAQRSAGARIPDPVTLESVLAAFATESIDSRLVVTLLQRESNLRLLADARQAREGLTRARAFAADVVGDHQRMMADWIAHLSQWDPALGENLLQLEDEECDFLRRMARLEEGLIAACDAERSLVSLSMVLRDAVDAVDSDRASNRPNRGTVRMELLGSADRWVFEIQATLARAWRALCGTPYLDAGAFQADILTRFAGWCFMCLGRDLEERDGTSRASRAVSWTLATVRALRGYLARSEFEAKHALDGIRIRRTNMLSRIQA